MAALAITTSTTTPATQRGACTARQFPEYDILVNVAAASPARLMPSSKVQHAPCVNCPDNRKPLKSEGHLSRDPRKERRKYGLKKARKAPQFSRADFFVCPRPTFTPPGIPKPR